MVDIAATAARLARAAPDARGAARAARRFVRRAATPLTPQWWGTLGAVSLVLCLAAGLLAGGRSPSDDTIATTASLPGGDPAVWSPVVRPQTMFTLDLGALGFERPTLDVRRHGGGGREDVFTAAAPGDGGAFLRFVAYRYGSEVKPAGTLFVETARRAAEAGLAVARTTAPTALPTRFGLAEASGLTLLDGDRRHECLAWRLVRDDLDLRLSGWFCPGRERRAERATLSCVVDRLDLAGAVTDRDLRRAFEATRRDPGCPAPARAPAPSRRNA